MWRRGSKRHIPHAVELLQRSVKPCADCVDPSRPINRFMGTRPSGPAR